MGSRLNVSLQQMVGQPNVEVRLFNEVIVDESGATRIEYAEVKAKVEGDDFQFIFDAHTYKGETTLSCDWNWFRYPNDPEHFSRKLLRMLYSYSMSFTVHH